ncbi:uroporphyrinogen-III C-methyltransferase [Egicoccus halophilus]|uniref:uroporphyrinogen-III C-methyltransferase n=1 Tax=Egicoccus halophilus TaxID=1670830 RepID=A0A8J3AG07_9ACTN|nr:uroporphyrinogen-III C-methyltransferase [Egicoccus halophilus]GGI08468.1 hypothetical protein GCM10011354_29230 [Egicoccus halophilus]
MTSTPVVHLVGAGPGAADLLTLRAARLLGEADLVVHDQLVTPDVLRLVGPRARLVSVGRRQGHVVLGHDEVVALLAAAAHAGQHVVRLKGGDPVVFGRGGEESLDLAARGVATAYVPGITSAVAAPELAGIPVTHRGLSAGVLVLTGQRARGGEPCPMDLAVAAAFDGTVVLLMGATRLAAWCRGLVDLGRRGDTPAALIAHAGRPEQTLVTGTLGNLAARVAEHAAAMSGEPGERLTPATAVVGDVVGVPAAVDRLLAATTRVPAIA